MSTYWNKFGESIKTTAYGENLVVESSSAHFPTCVCSAIHGASIIRAAGFYSTYEDAAYQAIRDVYFDLRPWSCGDVSYTYKSGVGSLYFGDYRLVKYDYSAQLLYIDCEDVPAEAEGLLDVVFDTLGAKISNIKAIATTLTNIPIKFPKYNPNNK